MSYTGVPFTKSNPVTCNRLRLTSTNDIDTRVNPILFGRCGLRVASIPTLMPLPRGGRTFVFDRCDQQRDVVRRRAFAFDDEYDEYDEDDDDDIDEDDASNASNRGASVLAWKLNMIQQ